MKLVDELKKKRSSMNNLDVIKKTHYNNIVNHIKYINSCGKTTIIYTIPLFLPSLPVYDMSLVSNYLSNKLKRDGFKVEKIKTDQLYITW
jgi:hypothetical protein